MDPQLLDTAIQLWAPQRHARSLSRNHGGSANDVYVVELDDGQEVVLRCAPDWACLHRDTYLLQLLRGHGIPAPEVLYVDDTRSTFPQAFSIQTRMPGSSAKRVLAHLPPSQCQAFAAQMGALLARVHQIPLARFGVFTATGVGPPDFRSWGDFYGPRSVNHLAKLEQLLPKALYREAADLLPTLHRLIESPTPPVLCHYDFHPGNLLVVDCGGTLAISAVVDLDLAFSGDAAFDLASTLACIDLDGYVPGFSEAFLEGYGKSLPLSLDFPVRSRLYRLFSRWSHDIPGPIVESIERVRLLLDGKR